MKSRADNERRPSVNCTWYGWENEGSPNCCSSVDDLEGALNKSPELNEKMLLPLQHLWVGLLRLRWRSCWHVWWMDCSEACTICRNSFLLIDLLPSIRSRGRSDRVCATDAQRFRSQDSIRKLESHAFSYWFAVKVMSDCFTGDLQKIVSLSLLEEDRTIEDREMYFNKTCSSLSILHPLSMFEGKSALV